MASSTEIEVIVISAENLLINRRQLIKKNTFVVLKPDPFNSLKTSIDEEGGSYPAWNEKLILNLPVNTRFIAVEVYTGSKMVGSANIPVSDFVGGFLPENYLSFLSYRLRDSNSEKNGIINLSVKVKDSRRNNVGCATTCSRPWMGFPVNNNQVSGGMVMGIPLQYRF